MGAELTGYIISIDAPVQQRPDFDFFRLLNRVLWILLILASPFVLIIKLASTGAMIPAVAVALGLFILLRMIAGASFFSIVGILSFFNLGSNRETVPVRFIRVREQMPAANLVQLPRAGRPLTSFRPMQMPSERTVRIKGELTLGNLVEGEAVSFWGKWQGGTLNATRAYSHFARSWIEVQRSHSGMWLLFTLGLIFFLIMSLAGQMQALEAQINLLGIAR